jgi:hypothetical protein
LSGNAAIIPEMSEGLANCFCGQPWLKPPLNPSAGHGLGAGACCANSRLLVKPIHTATLDLIASLLFEKPSCSLSVSLYRGKRERLECRERIRDQACVNG